MRFWLLLVICWYGHSGWAQVGIPISRTFSEKFYFLDTNKYLHSNSYAQIKDSLTVLEKKAVDAGDLEFAGKLRLFGLEKLYFEGVVNRDTLEREFADLDSEAKSSDLNYLEANILQAAGDLCFDNKHPTAAIEHQVASYDIYKNFTADEFPPKQTFTFELGSSFYKYGDYDNAIKYMREALRTKRSTNNNMFCSIFNTIGMAYRHMGMYDSAIRYYSETYNIAVSLHNEAWMGIAEGNIGITYFYQKKYDEAIPLLEKDIETSIATNNVRNGVGSMAVLAAIYNYRHQYDKAEALLNRALQLAENRHFWPDYALAEQLYKELDKTYAAKGNYRLAYLYADSANIAKDSIIRRNDALTLSKAHDQFSYLESDKLRSQIKVGQVENRNKQIEVVFTIIGIVALLVVVVFIARERKRSEILLLNILPEKIAERLKNKEHPIADYFENASIIFIDMAGFTLFSDGRNPKEVVNLLNQIFTRFDALAEKYGLEKIKTIGDCYMAVSGLPDPNPNHAEAATQMALSIKSEMSGFRSPDGTPITFRIGLDCGPVVAGVIGRRKFIYDLWGDTVNTASRMESTGVAGQIHCSDRFKKKIEHKHKFVSRGETDVKGKGVMETWLIVA